MYNTNLLTSQWWKLQSKSSFSFFSFFSFLSSFIFFSFCKNEKIEKMKNTKNELQKREVFLKEKTKCVELFRRIVKEQRTKEWWNKDKHIADLVMRKHWEWKEGENKQTKMSRKASKKQIIAWAKSGSWEHCYWVYCKINSISVKRSIKRISYDSIQTVYQEAVVDTNESIFHSEAGKTKKRPEEASHTTRQSVKSLMVTYLV